MSTRARFVFGILAVALSAAACGTDSPTPAPTDVAASSGTSVSSEPLETVPLDPSLPGEPAVFGPMEGAQVAVVGVAHTATAALLAEPAEDADIVAELPADADGLEATGVNRTVGSGTWFEVSYDGDTGWLDARQAGELGATDDATAELIARVGDTPMSATIEELGDLVAVEFSSQEPPSRVAQSTAASEGDLHEVTFDVIGLGDDATLGFRLHVFGDPTLQPGQVALKSVERTAICARGVTDDGWCV
jgi:hypothetical protein